MAILPSLLLMEVFPDGRVYNISGRHHHHCSRFWPEVRPILPVVTAKVCVEMCGMVNWTVQPGSCLWMSLPTSPAVRRSQQLRRSLGLEQGKTRIAHQKILLGEGRLVELPLHEN